ncbi:MAG TPA: cyclic nucleotide-binding domain-containing protein [Candidatus Marinimicrobia bacterium]|nr:cyclic nucleotide-binding domain-containing protein [Candidatus Neomarinimicrobiota bacterium]
MASPLWTQIGKKEKNQDERIKDAIKNVNIFRNLTDKEISEVKNAVYNRTYKKGDYIFKQGHPGNGMYIILTGTIQIIQEKFIGDEKKEEVLATLREGDFLGELSLLDEAPRSASALCTEITEAMGFFRGDLMDVVNRKPVLGSKIILNIARVLGERLRTTNQMLSELQDKEKEKNHEHE